MGFLSFYKRINKNNNHMQPLSKLDLDGIKSPSDLNAFPENTSPTISDSFMVVGTSLSDITQSSLSDEIFNELPLSGKSDYYASSSNYSETTTSSRNIRHSLNLKSNTSSPTIPEKKMMWCQSNISNTSSLNISDSNEQTLTHGNNIIATAPTYPAKNQESANKNKKTLTSRKPELFINTATSNMVFPLISNINSTKSHVSEQRVLLHKRQSENESKRHHTSHHDTDSPVDYYNQEFTMNRMKERHRQEYRKSKQWSPSRQQHIVVKKTQVVPTFLILHQEQHQPYHYTALKPQKPFYTLNQTRVMEQKQSLVLKDNSNTTQCSHHQPHYTMIKRKVNNSRTSLLCSSSNNVKQMQCCCCC